MSRFIVGQTGRLRRATLSGAILMVAILASAACTGMWGEFDSVLDPEAVNDLYQGYDTVASPDEVGVVAATVASQTTLNLVCDELLDATGYVFQVATDEDFDPVSTIVFNPTGVVNSTTNELTATGLLDGIPYWWRVKAQTATEEGEWSTPVAVKIPLAAPVITAPASGSTYNNGTTITFSWGAVARAAGLQFAYANSIASLETATPVSVVQTSYSTSSLAIGTWYWRVRAVDSQGGFSPWSETRSVIVRTNNVLIDFSSSTWPTGFTRTGNTNWFISSGYAESGNIGDNQNSILTYQFTVPSGSRLTRISFRYDVNSESCCDKLRFKIQGTERNAWGGTIAWTSVSYDVSYSGGTSVSLIWDYDKDGSVSTSRDSVRIDDITLTYE